MSVYLVVTILWISGYGGGPAVSVTPMPSKLACQMVANEAIAQLDKLRNGNLEIKERSAVCVVVPA